MNEKLGDIALKMLLNQLETDNQTKPENVVLSSKLIIRNSVKNLNPVQ
jgi:DNA-binding LacI/PurR family transcriptional regulator